MDAVLFPNAVRQAVGSNNYIYQSGHLPVRAGTDCPYCLQRISWAYVKTLFDTDANVVKVLPCPRCHRITKLRIREA
jgi:hypothetical protein